MHNMILCFLFVDDSYVGIHSQGNLQIRQCHKTNALSKIAAPGPTSAGSFEVVLSNKV